MTQRQSHEPRFAGPPVAEPSARPTSSPIVRRLDDEERRALAAEIVQGLEERGLAPGAWLVDIARVRQSLREADSLLRRLEDAIIRVASSSPLGVR